MVVVAVVADRLEVDDVDSDLESECSRCRRPIRRDRFECR